MFWGDVFVNVAVVDRKVAIIDLWRCRCCGRIRCLHSLFTDFRHFGANQRWLHTMQYCCSEDLLCNRWKPTLFPISETSWKRLDKRDQPEVVVRTNRIAASGSKSEVLADWATTSFPGSSLLSSFSLEKILGSFSNDNGDGNENVTNLHI